MARLLEASATTVYKFSCSKPHFSVNFCCFYSFFLGLISHHHYSFTLHASTVTRYSRSEYMFIFLIRGRRVYAVQKV